MLSIEESTGVWVDESLLTPENLESAESLARWSSASCGVPE